MDQLLEVTNQNEEEYDDEQVTKGTGLSDRSIMEPITSDDCSSMETHHNEPRTQDNEELTRLIHQISGNNLREVEIRLIKTVH